MRQLADEEGIIILGQGYTPFGEPLWSAGSGTTTYGFTGEQWGAYTGLLFLRARYYEPGTGRFSTRDPVPGSARIPQSLHAYVYVWNRPIQLIDPSGRQVPPGQCEPGEICNSGTTGPYVSSISFPTVQYEHRVPYPDPTSIFGMSWRWEPIEWPSPLAELEDKQNLKLCAAPSSVWLLLHYLKPGSIYVRQEFFPEATQVELPLAGFVPTAGTGRRYVKIYTPPPRMQLIQEYSEGVVSGGVGLGIPDINISAGFELTTRGDRSLGLAIEAAVAEFEAQVGDNWQGTVYFKTPSPVTPKVGYGVDVVLPENRYLVAHESVTREAGGYQEYGRKKLGSGYWLIDMVRGKQRGDLYNWWHQNYCNGTWCSSYPEELGR